MARESNRNGSSQSPGHTTEGQKICCPCARTSLWSSYWVKEKLWWQRAEKESNSCQTKVCPSSDPHVRDAVIIQSLHACSRADTVSHNQEHSSSSPGEVPCTSPEPSRVVVTTNNKYPWPCWAVLEIQSWPDSSLQCQGSRDEMDALGRYQLALVPSRWSLYPLSEFPPLSTAVAALGMAFKSQHPLQSVSLLSETARAQSH